jgi:hypothetical protein
LILLVEIENTGFILLRKGPENKIHKGGRTPGLFSKRAGVLLKTDQARDGGLMA